MSELVSSLSELFAAIDNEDLTPSERLEYLHSQALPYADDVRSTVIAARAMAAADANDDEKVSQRQLAKRLGVSRPLVQQLVRAGRELRENQ